LSLGWLMGHTFGPVYLFYGQELLQFNSRLFLSEWFCLFSAEPMYLHTLRQGSVLISVHQPECTRRSVIHYARILCMFWGHFTEVDSRLFDENAFFLVIRTVGSQNDVQLSLRYIQRLINASRDVSLNWRADTRQFDTSSKCLKYSRCLS
jgi:hypothetical protein